jgi:pullulanase/glycogen debranching enzyme
MRFLMGSLQSDGGQYLDARHSVNYLEAHDDETFGDFVRIYLGKAQEDQVIEDLADHHLLSPEELKFNKLGAFILGTSQGMTMIHAGQEYGRSKVIEVNQVPDEKQGMIDRNSYNKDNTTNYLNYNIAKQNQELIDFYASVFRLRQVYPQLRKAPREALEPFFADSEFGIGYRIYPSGVYHEELLVLVNGSQDKPAFYNLPTGMWTCLLSTNDCPEEKILNHITLEPSSGVILKK